MSKTWESLFNMSKKIAEGSITEEEVKELQEMVTCFEYKVERYNTYINLTALSLSKIKIKATDKTTQSLKQLFLPVFKKIVAADLSMASSFHIKILARYFEEKFSLKMEGVEKDGVFNTYYSKESKACTSNNIPDFYNNGWFYIFAVSGASLAILACYISINTQQGQYMREFVCKIGLELLECAMDFTFQVINGANSTLDKNI